MSLLDHPTAQALLADAEVSAVAVAGFPQNAHRAPSSAGPAMTRVTAPVCALSSSSQLAPSHQVAITNPR